MKRLTLNGTWTMRQAGSEKEYPANVPGSVLSALLDAKAIPDPYYRRNEYQARELFREDYSFYREFSVDRKFLEEKDIELVCQGLDTLAEIRINGSPALRADNMHREWRIPAKGCLNEGINRIQILFSSPLRYIDQYRYGENREIHYAPCGAMKGNQLIRKAHSMFGWDWGPQLPDAGIFRDIFLEGWTGRKVSEVRLHQIHGKEVRLQANIRFTPCISGQENQKLRVSVLEAETGREAAAYETLMGNRDFWEGELSIQNPRLWWPNGYGGQPLYTVLIRLENPDGSLAEEQRKTVGLRTLTVSRERDQWGREFAFTVNGRKIFAMGANYIPEDCVYSRITARRQEYLLESARQANFNCIRVWGGGYYPSDVFYELCDQKGLIVWQDLMFACNVYEASDHFLENCRQEVLENVKRLRHHPCLGLWCGNNEIESAWDHWDEFQTESPYLRADYLKLFEYIIPAAVKEADPDTFFWPSSPSSGGCFSDPDSENDGDAHYWDVWHGQKPFTDYRSHYFRFCSEFGFQSFPGLKTIESFTIPEDRNIFSRVMESHQKNGAANGKILYYLSENFRYPSDFGQLLYVSQILQGMAIQYGVEHWRRNRGRCMGTLYWQLNDNWPVASWSSIDYFGRWKALHYMAKRFYAPLASSIVLEGRKASLFIENETMEAQAWEAKLLLKTMDCKILGQVWAKGVTNALSSGKVLEMDLEAFAPAEETGWEEHDWEEQVFVEGQADFSNGRKAKNVETLLPYKYLQLKKPQFTVCVTEQEGCFAISLKSDCFTPFVELDLADADGIFSDNYFHLTDMEGISVSVNKPDIGRGVIRDEEDFCRKLRVRSLNQELTAISE